MVLLHIKRGETSQFLYETTVTVDIHKLNQEVTAIFNGRLKIRRICAGSRRFFSSSFLIFIKNYFRAGRACKLWLYAAIGDGWIDG